MSVLESLSSEDVQCDALEPFKKFRIRTDGRALFLLAEHAIDLLLALRLSGCFGIVAI